MQIQLTEEGRVLLSVVMITQSFSHWIRQLVELHTLGKFDP